MNPAEQQVPTPAPEAVAPPPPAHHSRPAPPPALFAIIIFKMGKGIVFLALGIVLYFLSDKDLNKEYHDFLTSPFVTKYMLGLRIHPESAFFERLAEHIAGFTRTNVRWAAFGSLVFAFFELIEALGMYFRANWAGWLAIIESSFFIPVEFDKLSRDYTWHLLVVTILNICVVFYLFKYREKLFPPHPRRH